jgi:ABC-2 type transport system permease protein
MSATTFPFTAAPRSRALTIRRTFKAELTKLRTLPSTWRTFAGATVVSIGLGTAIVAAEVSQWSRMSAKEHAAFDPTSASLIGLVFAAVIVGSLAVRMITGEYSSGMIRSTFTALPARRTVLVVKAATIAALAFPVGLVCTFVGFEIGQQFLAGKHADVALSHPGVLAALAFGALAMSLVAVIGVGLGGVLRRTAAATTTLSLVIIGGAMFGQFLPTSIGQYLPSAVIQSLVTVRRTAGLLSPLPALAVLFGYAAIAMWAATSRIAGRDA